MKISGDGFLSQAGLKLSQDIADKYSEKLQLLDSIICKLREVISDEEVTSQNSEEDKQRIIALIVAVRLLEITEAASLVIKHGMNNEVNSMFRIFLDAYFVIGNVCSDKAFVANYFNADEKARLKLLNSVEKHDSELFREINEYATKELKDELKEKIAEENIQAFSSYAYASNIDCEGIYDSMYRITSAALHTTPRSLENYVEGKDDVITSINYYPLDINIAQRIYDYSYFLIKVISGLTELFGKQNVADIDDLMQRLEAVKKQ